MELQALADALNLSWQGDASHEIRAVASLASAQSHDLCFVNAPQLLHRSVERRAGAYLVHPDWDIPNAGNCLFSSQPHLDFVRAIALLLPDKAAPSGLHATAVIGQNCQIPDDVSIAAGCVLGDAVKLGAGVRLGPNCVIGEGVSIGPRTQFHSHVTVEKDCQIGADCLLHSGSVIGSDGFGLVETQDGWVKVPQLGKVLLGDRVEVGANTTIDRGALDDTLIGNGVKLDNQIQIAHNVVIGDNTAMAACVGVAGSARIGKDCRISGAAVVLGHLEVTDRVTVTAMSLVTKSLLKPGVYSSGTPLLPNRAWNKTNARYKSLDELAKRIAALEKKPSNNT